MSLLILIGTVLVLESILRNDWRLQPRNVAPERADGYVTERFTQQLSEVAEVLRAEGQGPSVAAETGAGMRAAVLSRNLTKTR